MRPGDLTARDGDVFAIKKFKPDKEGDVMTYAGISQSAAREIMVCLTIASYLASEGSDRGALRRWALWFWRDGGLEGRNVNQSRRR